MVFGRHFFFQLENKDFYMLTGSLAGNLGLHLGNEILPSLLCLFAVNCLPSVRVCTSDLDSLSLVFFFLCLTTLFCD